MLDLTPKQFALRLGLAFLMLIAVALPLMILFVVFGACFDAALFFGHWLISLRGAGAR